ncbi:MAG: cyanophycin synthetase [Patescibacteria group bacterium]
MINKLKRFFYFPFAYYFRFFAKIRLARWNPYIIVVTGSSGKTTLLHLLESQIGEKAKYTHKGNSAYGIPFDILNLKRNTLEPIEWIFLFFLTPFKILSKIPSQKIYVVEADCDRPNEGKFLATLLKPEVTLWTSSTRTHSMNFDPLVKNSKFETVEEAIAFEFGYFLEYSRKLCIVNGDSNLIEKQFGRTKSHIEKVSVKTLGDYEVLKDKTIFKIGKETYEFNHLLPRKFFYAIAMSNVLFKKLNIKPDPTFKNFSLPPGRNSIFKGLKNTTIIDSSYNANLDSMTVILEMFDNITAEKKWIIAGDMLEQGESQRQEHEKLAEVISKIKSDKIILMGPRVSEYTLPKLKTQSFDFAQDKNSKLKSEDQNIISFENPKEVLEYLKSNLKGGELLLFKGARFLEGVIEHLLLDKKDIEKLPRREKVWQKRRRKFGL